LAHSLLPQIRCFTRISIKPEPAPRTIFSNHDEIASIMIKEEDALVALITQRRLFATDTARP